MKLAKIIFIASGLVASSFAMAEGGSDRVYDQMLKVRAVAAQTTAPVQTATDMSDIAQDKTTTDHPQC